MNTLILFTTKLIFFSTFFLGLLVTIALPCNKAEIIQEFSPIIQMILMLN